MGSSVVPLLAPGNRRSRRGEAKLFGASSTRGAGGAPSKSAKNARSANRGGIVKVSSFMAARGDGPISAEHLAKMAAHEAERSEKSAKKTQPAARRSGGRNTGRRGTKRPSSEDSNSVSGGEGRDGHDDKRRRGSKDSGDGDHAAAGGGGRQEQSTTVLRGRVLLDCPLGQLAEPKTDKRLLKDEQALLRGREELRMQELAAATERQARAPKRFAKAQEALARAKKRLVAFMDNVAKKVVRMTFGQHCCAANQVWPDEGSRHAMKSALSRVVGFVDDGQYRIIPDTPEDFNTTLRQVSDCSLLGVLGDKVVWIVMVDEGEGWGAQEDPGSYIAGNVSASRGNTTLALLHAGGQPGVPRGTVAVKPPVKPEGVLFHRQTGRFPAAAVTLLHDGGREIMVKHMRRAFSVDRATGHVCEYDLPNKSRGESCIADFLQIENIGRGRGPLLGRLGDIAGVFILAVLTDESATPLDRMRVGDRIGVHNGSGQVTGANGEHFARIVATPSGKRRTSTKLDPLPSSTSWSSADRRKAIAVIKYRWGVFRGEREIMEGHEVSVIEKWCEGRLADLALAGCRAASRGRGGAGNIERARRWSLYERMQAGKDVSEELADDETAEGIRDWCEAHSEALRDDDGWNAQFSEIEAGFRETGDLPQPGSNGYQWVVNNRATWRNGDLSMTADRVAKLKSIGVTPDLQQMGGKQRDDDGWNAKFDKATAWELKHGSLPSLRKKAGRKPSQTETKLARWLKCQEQFCRKNSTSMTADRRAKLRTLGVNVDSS